MLWVFTILIAFGGIMAWLTLSMWFSELAGRKGYSTTLFFWMSLLFGVMGYIWIAALPDRATREQLDQVRTEIRSLTLCEK